MIDNYKKIIINHIIKYYYKDVDILFTILFSISSLPYKICSIHKINDDELLNLSALNFFSISNNNK